MFNFDYWRWVVVITACLGLFKYVYDAYKWLYPEILSYPYKKEHIEILSQCLKDNSYISMHFKNNYGNYFKDLTEIGLLTTMNFIGGAYFIPTKMIPVADKIVTKWNK